MPKEHSRENRQEKDNALNTGSRDIAWTVNAAFTVAQGSFTGEKAHCSDFQNNALVLYCLAE